MADETTTDTHLALRQVMTKVLGERDITRNEALHQLMGLDLHTSNITVVKTSLECTKGINKNKRTNQLEFTNSFVDMYSNRFSSVKFQATFEENDYNFMELFSIQHCEIFRFKKAKW